MQCNKLDKEETKPNNYIYTHTKSVKTAFRELILPNAQHGVLLSINVRIRQVYQRIRQNRVVRHGDNLQAGRGSA